MSVRLNNGAGAFGPSVDSPVAGGSAQDLAAGDFNGDGRLDVVVTINDPAVSLSLLTGNGDGTFNAPVNFANNTGSDSPAVVAVDLNNDAKLDVVVAHAFACFTAPCVTTLAMSVMVGNGDGTFQPSRQFDVGRGMAEIAVGDFNRDGVKDLAIAGDSSRVYRLSGVGDGTFVQQPTLTLTADTFGVSATDIDVADFNGDTIEDLVVAIGLNGSRTAVLIGNGDGSFRAPLILTDPNLNIPQYQAVADYNGDGFSDLALSMGDGLQGLMNIRNGNGDGTFQPPVAYLMPGPLSSAGGSAIVAANLNSDTKPDIVIGQSGAFPGLKVLLNTTGAAPPPTPSAPTLIAPAQDATPAQPVVLDWSDVNGATSVSHPDRRLEHLLGAAHRGPDRVDIPAHRPHPGRAAALVAGAGHQLGGYGRPVVVGAAIHTTADGVDADTVSRHAHPDERGRRHQCPGNRNTDQCGRLRRRRRHAVEQQHHCGHHSRQRHRDRPAPPVCRSRSTRLR